MSHVPPAAQSVMPPSGATPQEEVSFHYPSNTAYQLDVYGNLTNIKAYTFGMAPTYIHSNGMTLAGISEAMKRIIEDEHRQDEVIGHIPTLSLMIQTAFADRDLTEGDSNYDQIIYEDDHLRTRTDSHHGLWLSALVYKRPPRPDGGLISGSGLAEPSRVNLSPTGTRLSKNSLQWYVNEEFQRVKAKVEFKEMASNAGVTMAEIDVITALNEMEADHPLFVKKIKPLENVLGKTFCYQYGSQVDTGKVKLIYADVAVQTNTQSDDVPPGTGRTWVANLDFNSGYLTSLVESRTNQRGDIPPSSRGVVEWGSDYKEDVEMTYILP